MNKSELSGATQSADAFAAPQTYVFPRAWNDATDTQLPSDPDEGFRDGMAGVGGVQAIVGQLIGAAQTPEVPPWLKVERPDVGLWLLRSSARRHDQWQRLQAEPQDDVKGCKGAARYESGFVKRGFDVAASLFLLVALLPLFLLTAILIRLDSSGSVFFRHYRVGKNGKRFMLWKFRSMTTDVPKYAPSPRSVVDARLTRVGRWIRRMSIDELPQLFNVLKGEMSLVGPRPEMPFIVARYRSSEYQRLALRPGITGLWQISPARAFPIHENLQYDLHYIRNQNIWLDCAIILRTISAIIHGIGAI